ncbi:unnamed protein product, partial [Staurois parvus]
QAPRQCRVLLQTFVKEWAALRSSVNSRYCDRLPSPIQAISLLLNISRSTVSGIITKWKQLGTTTTTQPRSGRPHKMTEQGQHMLNCTVRRSRQLSAESIDKDFQTLCALQISTITVHRELQWMGRAAASKLYITKSNAKHQMQWCKARHHWTLEKGTCLTAMCQV